MYWIFLVLFIIAVMVPDIIRGPYLSLSQTRVEEIVIFILGAVAFLVFIEKEKQLIFHRKEKEKDQKKLTQTVKDLMESYSYIGEVNRKMDLIMNIALGITDRSVLDHQREKEIYDSIVEASTFLMKADAACLRFLNIKTEKTLRDVASKNYCNGLKNGELTKISDDINVEKRGDNLIITSSAVDDIKACLVVNGYDDDENNNPKNIEILKVFVSQAIFLYSYASKNNSKTDDNN